MSLQALLCIHREINWRRNRASVPKQCQNLFALTVASAKKKEIQIKQKRTGDKFLTLF